MTEEIKVYAEYIKENNQEYRKNTKIKIGNSDKIIGSAVLINPGSAEPINCIDKNGYREFKLDSTMRFLIKIFNGAYVQKQKKIEGVIQLFNLFNLKNQNLNDAINEMKILKSEHLYSDDILEKIGDKPCYFGFGKVSSEVLRKKAEYLFNNLSMEQKRIYKLEFDKNKFYHPMYINCAYNQNHFDLYKKEVLEPFLSMG